MSKVWATFDRFELELPQAAVDDCSQQGCVDDAVEHWQRKIEFGVSRDKLIAELKEYGAWSFDELSALDDDELERKILWIAACNISEEQFEEECKKNEKT